MKRFYLPLFAECLSYLNRPASSTEWFPFPSSFYLRPDVIRLPFTYQTYAVRLLTVCCRLRSPFLSGDVDVLCEQIGANPKNFDINIFLASGFLSEDRLIDREIEGLKEADERATPEEVKAILAEAKRQKPQKQKAAVKEGLPLKSVK